jgi:hypothetical protein
LKGFSEEHSSDPTPVSDQCRYVRATVRTIEIFHRGKRVAAHQRRYGGARHGTNPDHMPSSHRRYAEWTPERFRRWAASVGPQTEALIAAILANRPHPEQGFRTCLGVLRLFREIDHARAEMVSALGHRDRRAHLQEHRLDLGQPSGRGAISSRSSKTDTGADPPSIIGNPTIAAAVLHRLVHSAYRVELTGESMRKTRSTPPPAASPA